MTPIIIERLHADEPPTDIKKREDVLFPIPTGTGAFLVVHPNDGSVYLSVTGPRESLNGSRSVRFDRRDNSAICIISAGSDATPPESESAYLRMETLMNRLERALLSIQHRLDDLEKRTGIYDPR